MSNLSPAFSEVGRFKEFPLASPSQYRELMHLGDPQQIAGREQLLEGLDIVDRGLEAMPATR